MTPIIAFVIILSMLLTMAACARDPLTADPMLGGMEAPELPTVPTVHIHDLSPATCTAPVTCSTCGETFGFALGHEWTAANCVYGSTCMTCKQIRSLPTKHKYQDGFCSGCGRDQSEYDPGPQVWVGLNGNTTYHSYDKCTDLLSPYQIPKSVADLAGYTPCLKCC